MSESFVNNMPSLQNAYK